jgi:RNA polymerase sigma-70 factor, ECF subfamily
MEASPQTARSGIEELDLIERLRDGEEQAFALLVQLHGGRLLATARRLLRDEEDARDAVQKTFLSALQAIDAFGGNSRISTWLHRIVVNAALMELRTRRRRAEEMIDDLLPEFEAGWRLLRPVQGWERPADELLVSAETRRKVRRAIDRLPDAYREVLYLRVVEEFDTEETARQVSSTVPAAKLRLHRARQALRTLLERELGGA